MKKRIFVLFLSILALMLCMAACKQPASKDEAYVTSIELVSGTLITEYNVGDTPDFSGIKVKVTYSDNTTKEIGYADVQISTIDTSTAGEKTVTVTYGEFKVNFKVTVKEVVQAATLSSIKIVAGTVPSALYLGQSFDVSELQVEALYSDGTKKILSSDQVQFTAIDASTAGDKTFTVTYEGKTDSMTVKVHDITSIKVVTGTIASKLFVGETLDTSKIEVLVTYSNGDSVILSAASVTVGALDTTTYGVKNVDVTYNGITIQYEVEVVGEVSVSVLAGSVPTSVKVGEVYDASKIKAVLTYSGTSTDPIELTAADLTVSAIDTSTAGDKTLKVTYHGLETTVAVKVVGVDALVVGSISNEVLKGNAFDASGIQVSVQYTDGTTAVVGASALTLGTIDTTKAGEQKLTITYLDKTVAYTVTVCEVTSIRVSGVSDSAQSGKKIDISGLKVEAVYNDKAGTAVVLTDGITTNVDELNTTYLNSTEARTLIVTYNGAYGSFTENVIIYTTAPELVGIEIRNCDTEALLGGSYDWSSVVVYANYGNATSKKITDFTHTEVATNVAGAVTFTVTYEGKTATATVTICSITSLELTGLPLYVPAGQEISTADMVVYGVYNDTGKTKIPLTDGSITTNVEDHTEFRVLTVTYTGTYGTLSTSVEIPTTAPILEDLVIQTHVAEILLGEAYGKDKVQVLAIYGNGREVLLDAEAFSMTPVDTTVGGSVTFTISYTDTENDITKTAQATVKVCVITALDIEGVADSVQTGNKIDISGMQVYGVYNDSKGSRVLLEKGTYTTNVDALNANVNSNANRILEVTYGSVVDTFEIFVTAPALTDIEIFRWDKTIGVGGTYDKNSVWIAAVYGNGSVKIMATGFDVSDISTNAVGNVTLTATYEGKTASVTVEVIGIKSLQVSGISTLVEKGYPLYTGDVTVTVTFMDDSTRIVKLADGVKVSEPDTTSGGDKQLTVSYFGASTKFDYHVKAVVNFEIFSGLPYVIRTGYPIDYSALKIKVFYTNGDEDVITAASLGSAVTYGGTNVGDTVFSVTYEGITRTRELVEAKLHQVHALNGTIPGSVLVNTHPDYSAFRITLVYRYDVGGAEKEDIILIKMDDPNLFWNAGEANGGYIPARYLFEIKIDTKTAGDRLVQFVYMPQATNEMGIPLYQAQAKIIVVDVASVSIVHGSIPTSVKLGDQYDVTNIKVQVNYTDGTYKYVSLSDLVNVSTLDTSAAGEQTLTVTYQGPSKPYTATYTVTVIDTSVDLNGNLIFAAMLPDSLIARDSYKGNFRVQDNPYVVGNDNPYVLYLNVAVLDKHNKLVDVNGESIRTAVKIYETTGGQNTLLGYETTGGQITFLDGDTRATVVTFTPALNSYQFAADVIDRTFRLEVRPETGYIDEAAVTVKHEILVVDGYNIYDEFELNLITNKTWPTDSTENIHENLPLERLEQGVVVEAFLAEKFKEAKKDYVDPNSINAIILHRNMTIDPEEDLPDEYFHTYTREGATVTELIDHLEVYQREVSVNRPFTFYGNYYSVFSYNLPCVVPKNVWNNIDDYSNSTLFSFRLDIVNYWNLAGSMGNDNVDWPYDEQIANIVDVGFRDNDPNSNDQSASERHMRGLTCMTNKGITTNVTNVNVEAFVVAMRTEGVNCTVNLDRVRFYNCWQGQIFVWNDNGFQLDQWNGEQAAAYVDAPTLPGLFGTKINITDSTLAKCGGPVILAQSYRTNKAANNETGVDVVVDDKSVLYSYVTGQEAWFVAVNQTPMAAQIVALDALVKGTAAPQGVNASYLSDQKIQGVNTMNMVFVVMGVGVAPGEEYSGSFTKGGEVKMQMIKNSSVNNPDPLYGPYDQTWVYDQYMAIPGVQDAPIFQTSAGGTFFADPSSGCFSIDLMNGGAMGYASGTCLQGDYITMYMYGMGIVLEYYH